MNAVILFVVCIIVCFAISHSSAKKNEAKFHEVREANPNPAEHQMVDNQAGTGSWIIGFIIIAVVAYIAVANHMVF
jgi:hypothetical protein